ncbi:MAG: hypothetical protein WKF37_22440 [Bryobacteraceae bacterium]
MRLLLQWLSWIVGLSLQWLVLSELFAGPWRRFPFLLIYACCLALTTIADIASYYLLGRTHPDYAASFWAAELIRQSGLYCLVVSLISEVLRPSRSRRILICLIVTAAVVFWGGSLALHHQASLNRWMTLVTRNLSLCTAGLNLFLWFTLISREPRDLDRLMIAGGLGLQLTGEAVGQSIRGMQLSSSATIVGNIVVVLAHFLCLAVWWQALLRMNAPRREYDAGRGVRSLEVN